MATNGSSLSGNIVNIFDSMIKTLNSGRDGSISPNSNKNSYSMNMGNQNFSNAVARLGPNNIYQHVMTAAANPTYGRDFSLAHQYERPQTRFPLAEEQRPNERSENSQQTQMSLFGGKQLDSSSVNPFKNTLILYDSKTNRSEGGKNERYQGYTQKYSGGYKIEDGNEETKNPLKVKFNDAYNKISSVAQKVEKQGREYFKKVYDTIIRNEDIGKINNSYEFDKNVGYKIHELHGNHSRYIQLDSGYKPKTKSDKTSDYGTSSSIYPQNLVQIGYNEENSYGNKKPKILDPVGNTIDLLSLPSLDEFMQWQELKVKHQDSSPLEKIADSRFSKN